MSEIKVDTLTGKTTAKTVTVTVGATATQSLEQGLIKAWVLYDQLDGTADTVGSLNLSTLVDVATGGVIINLSNGFSAVDYCHLVGTSTDASNAQGSSVSRDDGTTAATTSSMRILTEVAYTGANDDRDFNSVAFVGSLS